MPQESVPAADGDTPLRYGTRFARPICKARMVSAIRRRKAGGMWYRQRNRHLFASFVTSFFLGFAVLGLHSSALASEAIRCQAIFDYPLSLSGAIFERAQPRQCLLHRCPAFGPCR